MTLRQHYAGLADVPWDAVIDTLRGIGEDKPTIGRVVEYRAAVMLAQADALLAALAQTAQVAELTKDRLSATWMFSNHTFAWPDLSDSKWREAVMALFDCDAFGTLYIRRGKEGPLVHEIRGTGKDNRAAFEAAVNAYEPTAAPVASAPDPRIAKCEALLALILDPSSGCTMTGVEAFTVMRSKLRAAISQ